MKIFYFFKNFKAHVTLPALLAYLLCFSSAILANNYDSIKYNLLLSDIKKNVLQVEMVTKGKFKDKAIIALPYVWAGTDYTEQIKNISVPIGHQFMIVKKENMHQIIVTIPGLAEELKINYEIHQKQGNPADVHEVIIRNDLIHTPGYGVFATPNDLSYTNKIPIIINWQSMDPDWKTLSSYGVNKTMNLNITIPELLHAIYVAGKIRIYEMGDKISHTFLSLYGNFDVSDQRIRSDLKEIINSQRGFFNDFEFPYYAISLIEGSKQNISGGTALQNSFTAFFPKDTKPLDYYLLFSHEHLHNWIGRKIRNNMDEELNYWWTEGFTEFYSRVIALRSGGIDTKTFIKEVNQLLRLYYTSPANRESNSKIQKDFWKDADIEKLPYYRGFVFALYLTNKIYKHNPAHSLDNVMFDLFKKSDESEFSKKLFCTIMQEYISDGIEEDISSFIDKGNIITLETDMLPVEKILIGKYHLGFDRDAFINDKVIKNIDTHSNAYKAGLRNGQKILKYHTQGGGKDPAQIITIQTADGDFHFQPEHEEKMEIYQLKETLSKKEMNQFNYFFGIK